MGNEPRLGEVVPLFELSNREARSLCAKHPVWLPVNPVEYHGPHLSLHNDRLVSTGLSREVHARLFPGAPFVVAADLEMGVDPTPGPGTRAVPFAVVRDAVLEASRALHALGAQTVIAMTWHGAPLHSLAIEPGLAWLRARGARALNPFNEALRELLRLDGARFAGAFEPIADRALRERMMATLRHDFHAGFFETSMALHFAPRSVKGWRDVPPCPEIVPDAVAIRASRLARAMGNDELAGELELIAMGLGWHALSPFPGYTGAPHLASAESGAVFAEEIGRGYAELVAGVLAGRREAPRPAMPWIASLTANGRLQPKPPAARGR